jgi:hypothetical protein
MRGGGKELTQQRWGESNGVGEEFREREERR